MLKIAILDSGLTQRRIAKRARIEETRMSRIVHGVVDPDERERRALARVLGYSQRDIFPPSDDAVM